MRLAEFTARLTDAGGSHVEAYRQMHTLNASGVAVPGTSWWLRAQLTGATSVSVTAVTLYEGLLALLDLAERHRR